MIYRAFQYALPAPVDLPELNAFLAGHRIASVTEHLLTEPGGPRLLFLVQAIAPAAGQGSKGEARVDYRAILDEAQFARFSRLREERKRIAEEESVPVYAIFTNSQLAEMARKPARSIPELAAIEGVGAARIEKYGPRMLARIGEPG